MAWTSARVSSVSSRVYFFLIILQIPLFRVELTSDEARQRPLLQANQSNPPSRIDPSKVVQLSRKPRLYLYEGFLSDEECDHLISLAQGKLQRSMVLDDLKGTSRLSSFRTSSGMFIRRALDDIVKRIEEKISAWTFLPMENGEHMQILHYGVNESYVPHYDSYEGHKLVSGGLRIATVLLYLYNVTRGGETIFPMSEGHLEEQSQKTSEKVALNPEKWVKFKLDQTARVSHNSLLFRYTPMSDLDSKGYVDLLIKVYLEGKMSQYMASLKPGDDLEVKGPIEKFKYSPNMKKQIGMIAGGTGITPMLQVITAILKNPDDNTQVSLLYANVSPDDILLKAKLDQLAASHPNLKIFYTIDNPSKNWKGGSGYISKDMILKGLPDPGEDAMILVCGPPGMMKHISGEKARDWTQGELSGLLKELGYTEEMVYKF